MANLTAVELDPAAAAKLTERYAGTNVRVVTGLDSLAGNDLHHFHADDTYNPVEPAALLTRLQTIGFARVTVTVDWSVKFVAAKAGREAGRG